MNIKTALNFLRKPKAWYAYFWSPEESQTWRTVGGFEILIVKKDRLVVGLGNLSAVRYINWVINVVLPVLTSPISISLKISGSDECMDNNKYMNRLIVRNINKKYQRKLVNYRYFKMAVAWCIFECLKICQSLQCI